MINRSNGKAEKIPRGFVRRPVHQKQGGRGLAIIER